jgi:hypothetical protein
MRKWDGGLEVDHYEAGFAALSGQTEPTIRLRGCDGEEVRWYTRPKEVALTWENTRFVRVPASLVVERTVPVSRGSAGTPRPIRRELHVEHEHTSE